MVDSANFELRIGRHSENDVVIQDKSVSRFHARLICRNNTYYIDNVQGQNGIYVNGMKIYAETKLDELDVVRLGGSVLNWKQYVRNQKPNALHTKEYKISFEDIIALAPIPQLRKNSTGAKKEIDFVLTGLIFSVVILIILLFVL
jgi:pSer/pThr/pTyr-binding forkhead associated (FHA) protein